MASGKVCKHLQYSYNNLKRLIIFNI